MNERRVVKPVLGNHYSRSTELNALLTSAHEAHSDLAWGWGEDIFPLASEAQNY